MAKKRKPSSITGELTLHSHLAPSHLPPADQPLRLACLHPGLVKWKAACWGRVFLLRKVGRTAASSFPSRETPIGVCPLFVTRGNLETLVLTPPLSHSESLVICCTVPPQGSGDRSDSAPRVLFRNQAVCVCVCVCVRERERESFSRCLSATLSSQPPSVPSSQGDKFCIRFPNLQPQEEIGAVWLSFSPMVKGFATGRVPAGFSPLPDLPRRAVTPVVEAGPCCSFGTRASKVGKFREEKRWQGG